VEEVTVKRGVACAALLALAFGCSSSTSDPNLDAWEREVKVLTPAQVGDRQYEELGGLLEEREPMRSGFGGEEEAVDAARQKLRRRAAELDADAVVIVECGRHVRSIDEGSRSSMVPEVVCHGVAIRWMD
jgi:hypothetical protein